MKIYKLHLQDRPNDIIGYYYNYENAKNAMLSHSYYIDRYGTGEYEWDVTEIEIDDISNIKFNDKKLTDTDRLVVKNFYRNENDNLRQDDLGVIIDKLHCYLNNVSSEDKKKDIQWLDYIKNANNTPCDEKYNKIVMLIRDTIYNSVPLVKCKSFGKCGQRCLGLYKYDCVGNCEYDI